MAFIIDCQHTTPCCCVFNFVWHLEYRLNNAQRREIRYEGGTKTLWANYESRGHRVIGRNVLGRRRFDYSIHRKKLK